MLVATGSSIVGALRVVSSRVVNIQSNLQAPCIIFTPASTTLTAQRLFTFLKPTVDWQLLQIARKRVPYHGKGDHLPAGELAHRKDEYCTDV